MREGVGDESRYANFGPWDGEINWVNADIREGKREGKEGAGV